LVSFAENSRPPSEDILTGARKVTKTRRKALHRPFEPDSLVPNLILCPARPYFSSYKIIAPFEMKIIIDN